MHTHRTKTKLETLSLKLEQGKAVCISQEQLAEKNFSAQLPSSVYTEIPVLKQKCLDRHQVDMPTNHRELQCLMCTF